MAGEWKYALWTYQPVALSHTPLTIVKAFTSLLTQLGWEVASWSGSGDDRYFLRADRTTLSLTQDAVGTAGNVAITKTGTAVTVTGMSGGSVSVKATGTIKFTALPADGDTITIGDGTTTVTFEFDNNSSVTGGNTAVTIGTTLLGMMDALTAAINASALATTSQSLTEVWRYDCDGVEQACGIHVKYNSGGSPSPRIEISAFIEDSAAAGVFKDTNSDAIAYYAFDNTVNNDLIMIAGEDGLWVEAGRDGATNNLAHLHVGVVKPIPEFAGTKDVRMKLTSQGMVLDLFGQITKISTDRSQRFVNNDGSNQNYTAFIFPRCTRGTNQMATANPVDGQRYPMASRDNFIGMVGNGSNVDGTGLSALGYCCSFGLINSPVDDHFKISPFWMFQDVLSTTSVGQASGSASNNVPPDVNRTRLTECRWIRQYARLAAIDQSLIPNNNYTDPVSGIVYRCALVADDGRSANLAIEWPSTSVTIPTTPTV